MPGIGIGISPFFKRGSQNWSLYWTALKAAMTNKPSQAYSMAANTFITTLVDGGVWAKLDRLFVFQAETNAGGEALLDWIHPTGTPAVMAFGSGGSNPTFTANQGFTFDLTLKNYINTQYNPTIQGTNFTLNSASLGFYMRKINQELVDGQFQSGIYKAGVSSANNLCCSPRNQAYSIYGTARFLSNVNVSANVIQTSLNQYFPGIYAAIREVADKVCQYRNNLKTELASNSVAVPDGLIEFGRAATAYYSCGQFAMGFIGGGLTESDMGILVDAYENFREAIDTTILIIGDSTNGEHAALLAVSELMDNDNYAITDVARDGSTMALQKAAFIWHSDEYLSHIKCVFVQIGINDVHIKSAAVCIAEYQDLIDTIRLKIGLSHKIIGVTMIPCNRTGDAAYIPLCQAILGLGGTPITGLDGTIDTFTTALNAGDNTLAAAYDSGDGLHENDAGRQIIADLYDAKLTELGL